MDTGRDVSGVEVFGFLGWITTSVAYSTCGKTVIAMVFLSCVRPELMY